MKETEFKALMHCGQYVDANLLENGSDFDYFLNGLQNKINVYRKMRSGS